MEDRTGKLIHIKKSTLRDLNVISANYQGKAKGYVEDLVEDNVRKQMKKIKR